LPRDSLDQAKGAREGLMHSVNGRQGAENPLSRDHEHNQNGGSEGVYPHPLMVIVVTPTIAVCDNLWRCCLAPSL